MIMRRNVVTVLLWMGAAAIFTIHVITQHRKSKEQVDDINERHISDVKTTIQKRTEIENIHQNINTKNHEEEEDETDRKLENDVDQNHVDKRELNDVNSASDVNNNYQHNQHDSGSGTVNLQNSLEKLQEEVEKLKVENKRLLEREHQFKNLARRLATQLKGREGGLLPKLDPYLPWIFAITPTYSRFTQKADLVRLSQTLLHVTNLHWILVEDSTFRTDLVSRFLHESGLSFTHLNARTPYKLQRKKGEKNNRHHRGVPQRNNALQWLRDNVDPKKTPGVVYFMDDDNTYHRKIFDEMRRTRRVSIWGVGFTGAAKWAGPIVKNGKVVRFHTNWAHDRSFPIDMAGFAVSLDYLLKEKKDVKFDMEAKRGYLEPTFLSQLTTMDQLEPMADNATKIYVWHTRTELPRASVSGEKALIKQGKPSDPAIEV